ncbi:MAG: ATP-binding protein [Myxococcota bacterium]
MIGEALEALGARPLPEVVLGPLRRAVGALGDELARIAPSLAAQLGHAAPAPLIEPERRQERFLTLLTALIGALGSRDRPLTLFVDDFQWAEAGTLSLLEALLDRARQHALLLVVACRGGGDPRCVEVGERIAHTGFDLALGPLEPHDVRALIGSMLGESDPEVVPALEQRASGNPLHVVATVQRLADLGVLRRRGFVWQLDAARLGTVHISEDVTEVVAEHLTQLSTSCLQVLTAAALIGRSFTFDLLVDVVAGGEADDPAGAVVDALDRGAEAHLVVPLARAGSYQFVQDQVRAALADPLSEGERTSWHQRIGEALERRPEDHGRVFALAYHFGGGTDPGRAVRYGIQAGQAALAANGNLEAMQCFERAQAWYDRGPPDPDVALTLLEGRGDAARMRGRFPQATAANEACAAAARHPLELARFQRKLGDTRFGHADIPGATAALVEALRTLGERFPQARWRLVLWVLWELVVLTVLSARPPRRAPSDDPVLVEIGRIYNRMTYVFYMGNRLRAAAAHLRHLDLMERHQVTSELGQAYSNHAPLCATVPLFGRGLRYARLSVALREVQGDRWGVAQSLGFYTLVLMSSGQHEAALDAGERARRELVQLGDVWELLVVLTNLGEASYRLGRFVTAQAYLDELARLGERSVAARHNHACLLGHLAPVVGSQAVVDHLERVLPQAEATGNAFTLVRIQHGLGRALLRLGRFEEAITVLEDAVARMQRERQRSSYLVLAPVALADAYVSRLEQQRPETADRARVRQAHRAVARAMSQVRWFPNDAVYARTVQARLLWWTGRRDRAVARCGRRTVLAVRQGNPYERARVLLTLGRRTEETVTGQRALREAERLHEHLGALEDLAQIAPSQPQVPEAVPHLTVTPLEGPSRAHVDSATVATLVEVGQQLSRLLDVPELLAGIVGAATTITRAERGFVYLADGDGLAVRASHGVRATEDATGSASIARRVHATGEGVLLADAAGASDFETADSVATGALLSVLCVPLRFQDQALGVLYVDNRLARGMFSEADLRVLASIASQAAVALTNATAFARLRDEVRERIAAEEAARASTQAKSRFLANMSHELRTPLNAVIGYTEMVREELQQIGLLDACDDLERVESSARHLLRLIDDILDLSRIEAGRTELALVHVSVALIAARAAALVQPLADTQRVALEVDVDDDCVAHADEARLLQVLVNLTTNAAKFSPRGTVKITGHRRGDDVEIEVSDDGIGMDADALAVVFERFRQVDDAPTRRHGGIGLGLAICRELTRAMGGEVVVASERGVGTTFTVRLPAGSPEATLDTALSA